MKLIYEYFTILLFTLKHSHNYCIKLLGVKGLNVKKYKILLTFERPTLNYYNLPIALFVIRTVGYSPSAISTFASYSGDPEFNFRSCSALFCLTFRDFPQSFQVNAGTMYRPVHLTFFPFHPFIHTTIRLYITHAVEKAPLNRLRIN
jgi:hypothetical protein